MRVLAGTSGFAYKSWKGSFYPAELPEAGMLRYYAGRFGTVEINNTFYRMPTRELLARWAQETPPGFTFALKAPQRITHRGRLANTGEPLGAFFEAATALGPKLGPALFQLPPNFRKDLVRLREFLDTLPPRARAAFEFRHASWEDAEVHQALREHGAALCVADTDEGPPEPAVVPTAGWGYLRLRRADYGPEALRAWAGRILLQPWEEAYVFFKHEEEGKGPRLAEELALCLSPRPPA